MANTRKTTKPAQVVEPEEVKVVKPEPSVVKKSARKFDLEEYIDCQSVVYGPLYIKGVKSGVIYQWSDYGDITPVMYGDLMSLYSMRDKAIIKPRIKILDEDLVEQWGKVLKDIYNRMCEEDIEAILAKSPKALKSALEAAPDGIKIAVKTVAANKIRTGELDSLAKIKIIDETLGTDLRLLAE